MKISKLFCAFAFLIHFQLFSLVEFSLIPTFYDMKTDKTYGLFFHEQTYPSNEWTTIDFSAEFDKSHHRLRQLLGNLYNQFQIIEDYDIGFSARGHQINFIPVKKFISAEQISRAKINNFDGAIWLDIDELAKQHRDAPKSFVISGEAYTIKKNDTGFSYHLTLNWNRDAWLNQNLNKYKAFMKTQPEQQVVLRTGQSAALSGISKPSQLQEPEKKVIVYPKDALEEYRFFYDAYYGDKNALLKDIDIAKRAGTLNATIRWGGDEQTALTHALNNYAAPEIIEILLKNGVNPNIKNGAGQSPLKIAILRGMSEKILELLLQYGADIHERIQARLPGGRMVEKSLIDLAARGMPIVLEILKKHAEPQPAKVPINDLIINLQQLNNALNSLARAFKII